MTAPNYRFVVDELAVDFEDEEPSAVNAVLGVLSDAIDAIRASDDAIACWSDIWSIQSNSGRSLIDHLFNSSVDPDSSRRFARQLDQMVHWDDDFSISSSFEVVVNGVVRELSPSVGVAAQLTNQFRWTVGCLTRGLDNPGKFFNKVSIGDSSSTIEVPFIKSAEDIKLFWRHASIEESFDPETLAARALVMFPSLVFSDQTWGNVNAFGCAFREIRVRLVRHLSALDDHALPVWLNFVEPHRISAEMASRAGIDCSSESVQTRHNASAMARRLVLFADRSVTCLWHTKIEPNRYRIHFAVEQGRVYVGLFTSHLPT